MKLKFCGFKTLDDVEKAKNLNIDAIGFIHYPKSKRFVDVKPLINLPNVFPTIKRKWLLWSTPAKRLYLI